MRKESIRLTATVVALAMVSGCSKPEVALATPYFTPVPPFLSSSDFLEGGGNASISLSEFIEQVEDGTDLVRGLYADDKFTFLVRQQSDGDWGYVTSVSGELSQFRFAEKYGAIGLLGHVNLVGNDFSKVSEGQEMSVVFGNRKTKTFRVTEILRFKAFSPNSPYSDFVRVDGNNQIIEGDFISANDLFLRIYTGNRLVLQTCIDGNGEVPGEETWGRFFIIAEPVGE